MELTLDQALHKGVEAHKEGRVQEADQYYTAILKANPKHPDANHNMGVLAVGVGKVQEALPFFKAALDANPNISQFYISYIDALLKLDLIDNAKAVFGQAKNNSLKGNEFDQIEKRYAEVFKTTSETSYKNLLAAAIELRESGKFEEAIKLLKTGINLLPKDPNIKALIAHCHILADNIEQAGSYLTDAKHIDANIALVGWNEARLLLKKRKFSEALAVAEKTYARYQNDIEGLLILGSCLRLNGAYEKSLKCLQKVLSIKPNYAEALINRGLINLAKDAKLNALTDFEKAHQLKPHIKEIWNPLVKLKIEFEELPGAIALSKAMIKIDPNNEKILINLAKCYQITEEYDEALLAYERIISLNPRSASAWNNLGTIIQLQGKLEHALKYYKKALSIDPYYADAYYNIGLAILKQGKLIEAIDTFHKALSINSNLPEAHMNIGQALENQKKPTAAIEAYEQAISLKPNFPEAYNSKGNALQSQNRLDEAIENYKKALSFKPDYVEAYNNMGNVLADQGKLLASIDTFKKAIKINPGYSGAWNNIFFPLSAIKSQHSINIDLEYMSANIDTYNFAYTAEAILNYKLNRGTKKRTIFFDKAITALANVEKSVIKNSKKNAKKGSQTDIPNKIVALVHFGRSGTGLLHSLIDGHHEVSTLPSIYLSEYFDHKTWSKLISTGWEGIIDSFTKIYDVLFDATSIVPINSKSEKEIHRLGIKEGMAIVGPEKNEALRVERTAFRSEMKNLMEPLNEVDALLFFKMLHKAYDKAINDINRKKVIFYHIHNPDTAAKLNFSRLCKDASWILMVREPIQSCESWVRNSFIENNHFGVATRIITMLFEIDDIVYKNQRAIGVRLEDLKNTPRKTIPALCKWMGITESESLYKMTAQGKKWWGDPSSPDYAKDGMNPFGKTSIKRPVGSVFSENDRLILNTLFYPFSLQFGYTQANSEQFKKNLQLIRPMLMKLFDFEKKILMNTSVDRQSFIASGSYQFLRSGLKERWDTLNKFKTYPNMIKPIKP